MCKIHAIVCPCCKDIIGVDPTDEYCFEFCGLIECTWRRVYLQLGSDQCEECVDDNHDASCDDDDVPSSIDIHCSMTGREDSFDK